MKIKKIRSGFTLIEVLAVIIILGILALIAIPIVNKITLEARKEAFSTSTKNLIKVIENKCDKETILSESYTESYMFEDGTPTTPIPDIDGKLPISGTIYVYNDCNATAENIADERFCASGTAKDLLVYVGSCDMDTPTCKLEVTNGDIGENKWYGEDIEVTMTTSVAGNSGLKYGIGTEKNYSNEINAGEIGTLKYQITDSGISNLYCYVESNTAYESSSSINIMIDKTAPTNVDFTTLATTNSITITASAIDDESGISRYSFSKDDGASWTIPQKSNMYTFTNLLTETYKIKVRAYNGTYTDSKDLNNYTDSVTKNVTTNELGVPVITARPTGWATSKVVTITYPSREENFIYEYSLDGESWESVDNAITKELTFNKNGFVIARVYDGTNYKTSSSFTVGQIDTTAPTDASISVLSKTTNSITVKATGIDDESGISKYEFAIDTGTYIDNGTNPNYTYTGVTSSQHTLKVRVTNGAGLTQEGTITNSPNEIISPTYSVEPSGWSSSKTVTITYPTRQSDFIYEYSLDGANIWVTVASGNVERITFTSNGSVIARVRDGVNLKTATSFTVGQIDTTAPTGTTIAVVSKTTNRIVVGSTATDNESGIIKYEFAIDSGAYIDNGTNSAYTFNNVQSGSTHTLKVRVTNGAGLTSEATISDSVNLISEPTYSIDKQGWQLSKVVTITYPTRESDFIYDYSLDGGETWTTVATGETVNITFNYIGTVIARVYDGTNYKTASSYTVSEVYLTSAEYVSFTPEDSSWNVTNVYEALEYLRK